MNLDQAKLHDTPLPAPRLCLRVGGLGNRFFGAENGLALKPEPLRRAASEACDEVWQAIESELAAMLEDDRIQIQVRNLEREDVVGWQLYSGKLFGRRDRWGRLAASHQPAPVFRDQRPKVMVLTGAAIGGDQIIRQTALARQAPSSLVEWSHALVDLGPTQAGPDLILGTIPDSVPEPTRPCPREAARAYVEVRQRRAEGFRAQSEALRHHSDVLLAIWDPDTEGKAGGAAESVLEALRARVPVIAIRLAGTDQAEIAVLTRPEDLHRPAQGAWEKELANLLRRLLAFPDPPNLRTINRDGTPRRIIRA